LLLDRNTRMTVAFISNDEELMAACDQVLLLEKGNLKASGTYQEVKPHLKGL
jgi:ABC-type transport system involved in cytochrome bd biosynthesis fused ATPase/permease subunit